MAAELGLMFLCCAMALAIAQISLAGFARLDEGFFTSKARAVSLFHLAFVASSFLCLVGLFLQSDFSISYIGEHSHRLLPWGYKIAASWSGHEGSMLLFVLILAIYGALVCLYEKRLTPIMKADVLALQAGLSLVFCLFIVLTSNPFARAQSAFFEGQDLNVALQDPGLAIHPPLLYLGYVGYSITFCLACAGLIHGATGRAFAQAAKPWLTLSWIFLTLGIACGSFWAYYTLGWGGFWFWDPVENVSLMPWLAGTALLHSAQVTAKRGEFQSWTVLLALVAFCFSLIGTFIVRSGILTSVHSFASDPERGLFILVIIAVFVTGAFVLYYWKMPQTMNPVRFGLLSRETFLIVNNLLLTTLLATVFVGTLYPLAVEALSGEKLTVGAPYFTITAAPVFALLCAFLPFGALSPWIRGKAYPLLAETFLYGALSLALALLFHALNGHVDLASHVLVFLAGFVLVSSLGLLIKKLWRGKRQPLAAWRALMAMMLGHVGLGLFLLGLVGIGLSEEKIIQLRVGQSVALHSYDLTLSSIEDVRHQNTDDVEFHFQLREGGVVQGNVVAIKRRFLSQPAQTNLVGLKTLGLSQVYLALGALSDDGLVTVRIYWKALITLIWYGAIAMALGGLLHFIPLRERNPS